MKSSTKKFESISGERLQLNPAQMVKKIPRSAQWRLYQTSLIINDLVMMILAFRLAYLIRFTLYIPIFHLEADPFHPTYNTLFFALIPVWLFIFTAAGLYNRQKLLGGVDEYALVFRSTSISLFMVIIAGFLEPTFIIARGWMLLFWVFAFLLTAAGRFLLRRIIYFLRHHGYFLSPAVIVGANDEGLSLAKQLISWQSSGLHLVGFVDKKFPAGTMLLNKLRVLGNVGQLDEIIKSYGVEELILASSAVSSRDSNLEIFKNYGFANGINLRMSSGLYEIITTGLNVKELAYVPLVGVNKVRLTGLDQVLKLALDFGLTIPVLILISPLLLLIALAVKLDSPGPIIYRRRVMGVNCRQFCAFKFRTMREDGDAILAKHPELAAELAQNHKLKNDPRITRLGALLRKFSLDELPQLFNVLRLEMSLVGPRMISPQEMENYNHWGLNLLTVRPGITGLWQVSGRSDITYEERIRLDMHYIRNWSIWIDIQLLIRTIPAVLKGRGAY